MPGGDGSGPRGEGPMTGWGMGSCRPKGEAQNPDAPRRGFFGRMFAGFRRGRGCGFGRGFGWGKGRGNQGGAGWQAR